MQTLSGVALAAVAARFPEIRRAYPRFAIAGQPHQLVDVVRSELVERTRCCRLC